MKIELEVEEINILLNILGDTPTKTGLYPLMMKIKEQGDAALVEDKNEGEDV